MTNLLQILNVVKQDIFKFLGPQDLINLTILFKDFMFLEFKYEFLNLQDHLKLTRIFMDDYILFLLKKPGKEYNSVVKFILEHIDVESLADETLNSFHKGFWRYISYRCRLTESFVFKWSHKINLFRLKLNTWFTPNISYLDGWNPPRRFSKKFHNLFPGFKHYKPCSECFDDVDHHYKAFYLNNTWICEDCMMYTEKDSLFHFDYIDYDPPDRSWSDDNSD